MSAPGLEAVGAKNARICSATASSGETLPPRGFGAALLLSCQRCTHFIAELTLTSKRSAVSCRDAPLSTAPSHLRLFVSDVGARAAPKHNLTRHPMQRIYSPVVLA